MPKPPPEQCNECGKEISRGIANLVEDKIVCTPCYRSLRPLADGPISFHTKVVGVSKAERQKALVGCRVGDQLQLKREPENRYSKTAVAVLNKRGKPLGYLSDDSCSPDVSKWLDAGFTVTASISALTGGSKDKPTRGANILIIGCEPNSHSVAFCENTSPRIRPSWMRMLLRVLIGKDDSR